VSARAVRAAEALREAAARVERAHRSLTMSSLDEASASTREEQVVRRMERYLDALAAEREAVRVAEVVRRIEVRERVARA
jgi:hypothetical protein